MYVGSYQCVWIAGTTLLFFKLINYDNWFPITIGLTYVPAALIVPITIFTYMNGIITLHRTDYKQEWKHVTAEEARKLLVKYLDTHFQGKAENAS